MTEKKASKTGAPAGPVIKRVAVTVVHGPTEAELRTDVVVLRPVHLVMAERHYKGNVPPVEGTLFAAHHAIGHEAGVELPPFGVWLDEWVVAVEESSTDPLVAPPAAP